MVYADLHVHTNYSDGTHSIEEVIRLAKNRGIKVVAITDHDTLYHYDKVKKICEKNNIKTILSGNLIAIRTNKKVLNPFYLKTFLDSETGKAQLSSIQTGTSIKTITPKNLEKMEVSLLPKTDQDELATKYVKKIGEVKELINKYVSVMNEIEHIYDESIEIIPD